MAEANKRYTLNLKDPGILKFEDLLDDTHVVYNDGTTLEEPTIDKKTYLGYHGGYKKNGGYGHSTDPEFCKLWVESHFTPVSDNVTATVRDRESKEVDVMMEVRRKIIEIHNMDEYADATRTEKFAIRIIDRIEAIIVGFFGRIQRTLK